MQLMVFRIAFGEQVAEVGEDGSLEGHPELVAELRRRLAEPVTVYPRGTVAPAAGAEPAPLELRPGDGRYVVARIRTLCTPGSDYSVTEVEWREP